MGPLLLPLLDSKTIRIDPPVEPVPSNLGTEAIVAMAVLAVFLAALFLLPRLWHRLRPAAREVDQFLNEFLHSIPELRLVPVPD